MEEDEDDYMSDKFLNQSSKSDVRPGLLFNNKERRDLEQFKKKQENTPRSFQVISEERRKEGLETALPESNKGFAMMKKMGYTPETGIGKTLAGPCAPINIEVKNDNFGLGLLSDVMEKRSTEPKQTTDKYRTVMKRRQELNELKLDYAKIQRVCQSLDEKDDLKKPMKKWFWPDPTKENSDTESSSDSDSEKKVLKILSQKELKWRLGCISSYLREKYNYCLWCSIKFDDEKDMIETCPGRTRALHSNSKAASETDSD